MVRGDDKSSHEGEDATTNDYVRCPLCYGRMKKNSSFNFYCPLCGTTNREFAIDDIKMRDFNKIIDKLNEFNSFLRDKRNYKTIIELYQIGVIKWFPWLEINPATKLHTAIKDKVSETGLYISEEALEKLYNEINETIYTISLMQDKYNIEGGDVPHICFYYKLGDDNDFHETKFYNLPDAHKEIVDAIAELPTGFTVKDVQQKLPDYTERLIKERLKYLKETGFLQTIQSRGGTTTIYGKTDDLFPPKEDTHVKRIRHIDDDTYQLAKKVMAKYTNYKHIGEFITECCEYCLKHKYGISKESDIEDRTAQSNIIEKLLIQFVRVHPQWEGSPSDLLIELTDIAFKDGVDISSKGFPKSANRFTRELNKIKPNLRERGITIESNKYREKGRILRITSSLEGGNEEGGGESQPSSSGSSVGVETTNVVEEKSTPTSRLAKNYAKNYERLGYSFDLFEQTNTVEQKSPDIESIYRDSPKYLRDFLKGVTEWYLNKERYIQVLDYPEVSLETIKNTTCMAPENTQGLLRPDKILERVKKQSDFINIKFDQIIRIVEKDGVYHVVINRRRFKDLADMLAGEVRRAKQDIAEYSDNTPKISGALAQKLYDKYQFSNWHLNKLLSDTDNLLDGFYYWMQKTDLKQATIKDYTNTLKRLLSNQKVNGPLSCFYYLKQYLEGYTEPIREDSKEDDKEPTVTNDLAQVLKDKYQYSEMYIYKILNDPASTLNDFYEWMRKGDFTEKTIKDYVRYARKHIYNKISPTSTNTAVFYYLKQYLDGYVKPIRHQKSGEPIKDRVDRGDYQTYTIEPLVGSKKYLTSSIQVYPNNKGVKLVWPTDGREPVDVEISDVYSWFEELSTWAEKENGLKYLPFHRFKSKLHTYFQQTNTKEDYSIGVYYLVFNFYGLDERFNTKIERRKIDIITDWVIIFDENNKKHSYDPDLLKPEIDTDWFKKDRLANIEVMNDR